MEIHFTILRTFFSVEENIRNLVGAEFPHAKSEKRSFSLGEALICFVNDKRLITWDVPKNNHARERSRGYAMAKVFFKMMDKIDWKRGSGGTVWGNDEYNEELAQCGEGRGGSYIISTYGNKVKPPAKRV